MDFLSHSIAWCKGEIFEGRMILLFGILSIIFSLLFWKIGTTPAAKAMIFPILGIGLLFSGAGISMQYSNQQRIQTFTAAYQSDAAGFVQAEKERTETFMTWYPLIRYVVAGMVLLSVGMFLFWSAPLARASAITLLLLGSSILIIDFFSEERAEIYYSHIEATAER